VLFHGSDKPTETPTRTFQETPLHNIDQRVTESKIPPNMQGIASPQILSNCKFEGREEGNIAIAWSDKWEKGWKQGIDLLLLHPVIVEI
jgi:hypothetical protein